MDLPSRPKDNLFEESTMTFGEHLEELRRALRGAIIWLGVGLAVGLLFADKLVNFVQAPLEEAILTFRADREISRRNLDPKSPELQPLKSFLINNSFEIETNFLVPATAQDPTVVAPSNDEEKPAGSEGPNGEEDIPSFILAEQADIAALIGEGLDPTLLKRQVMLRPSRSSLNSHKSEEGFMIWLKAGLMIGAVLSSPMVFYHLWGFVAAGLYAHERKYVYTFLPVSVILFAAGVCLAFFFVLYYVLNFLLQFNAGMNVDIQPRLSYYMSFVLLLPLGFGIAFQLPLLMLFLERIGLFTVQAYVSSWRVAILVICMVAMILTPADLTSMIALAVPLVFLYFLGIAMCKYLPRGPGLGSAALDPR